MKQQVQANEISRMQAVRAHNYFVYANFHLIVSFEIFKSDSAEDTKLAEKNAKIQAKKKFKLEPKTARSRVMQICDSSSDEDETPNRKDIKMECEEESVVKKEKENKTPSPEKQDTNQTNADGSASNRKRRIKVKKMVTETYEDDDGFISELIEGKQTIVCILCVQILLF